MTNPNPDPTVWVDGHPQLEAIAAAVWQQCRTEDHLVVDDPRTIAVAALTAMRARQTGDRAALRDRIAAAIRRAPFEELRSDWSEPNGPLKITARVDDLADVVLSAVLSEPTDSAAEIDRLRAEWEAERRELNEMVRSSNAAAVEARADQAAVRAAALHEAADRLGALANRTTERGAGVLWTAEWLRRLTDDEPDDTLHACPGRWGGPRCTCFDDESAGPAAPAKEA